MARYPFTNQSITRLSVVIPRLGLGLIALVSACPTSVYACAACYGKSDSPMAKGMNWGIFSLLAVVVTVLGSIAGFAFYLAKRAGSTQIPAQSNSTEDRPSDITIYQSPLTDSR